MASAEYPAAFGLDDCGVAVRQNQLLNAITAVLELSAGRGDGGQQIVGVGYWQTYNGQELRAVGLQDQSPRLGLVQAGKSHASGHLGNDALYHLSSIRLADQRAE